MSADTKIAEKLQEACDQVEELTKARDASRMQVDNVVTAIKSTDALYAEVQKQLSNIQEAVAVSRNAFARLIEGHEAEIEERKAKEEAGVQSDGTG